MFPLMLSGNSSLDYGGMYKNAGMIVEGHLSGEVIEKIKIIRESTHPDVDFHEGVFIYTHLIVDGSVKFQKHHQWPDDEVKIEEKRSARYRVLIPERFYAESYKAKTTEEPNAWFVTYSPLGESLYAYEYLELLRTRMFIPDYMEEAVGVSIAPKRKNSNQAGDDNSE